MDGDREPVGGVRKRCVRGRREGLERVKGCVHRRGQGELGGPVHEARERPHGRPLGSDHDGDEEIDRARGLGVCRERARRRVAADRMIHRLLNDAEFGICGVEFDPGVDHFQRCVGGPFKAPGVGHDFQNSIRRGRAKHDPVDVGARAPAVGNLDPELVAGVHIGCRGFGGSRPRCGSTSRPE